MKSLSIFLLLAVTISTSFAGNGVERGRLINQSGFGLKAEIESYLHKKLKNCALESSADSFVVDSIELKKDEVDQGIVDLYYRMDITHKNKSGRKVNDLSIELEDSDYSNWRKYEEKLSIEVLKDTNKLCF